MRVVSAEEFKTLSDGTLVSCQWNWDEGFSLVMVGSDETIIDAVNSHEHYKVWGKADIEALIATLNKALKVAQ